MRILYLHQYFNTPKMWGGTRSYEMARRLVKEGHEVHVITSNRDAGSAGKSRWYQTIEEGVHVHWLQNIYSNKMDYIERIKSFVRFAVLSAHKAAAIPVDVVFATSTPLTIAISGVYASKKHRVPMVFEVRDLWPEVPIAIGAIKNPIIKKLARRLENFAYKNSHRIIALSPGMKEGIARTGFPSHKISVIPNSCDFDIFNVIPECGQRLREKYEWLGKRPLVLYSGTIGEINGVDYLAKLAAVAIQKNPLVVFAVIGEGKKKKQLIETTKDLKVYQKNFFILPSVSKIEISHWLAATQMALSLFVNIEEMWNNSANKFFDTLAAGVPVAINYGGWQAELISRERIGLVLDQDDVEAAANKVLTAIEDKKWLEMTGRAAKMTGMEFFARDKLAAQFKEVLTATVREYRQ